MGVTAPPRTASTLLLPDELGTLPVTILANHLRQSHPLINRWVATLIKLDFVETRSEEIDGRKTLITLTTKGNHEVRRLRKVLAIAAQRSPELTVEAGSDVFKTLWRMKMLSIMRQQKPGSAVNNHRMQSR